MKMKSYVLSLLLVLMPLSAQAAPEIGQPAPAFKGKTSDGKDLSLEDLKGKTVVLEWTNADCPFVVKHYGSNNMQALQETYTDKGVQWIRVISSAPGKQGHMTAEQAKAYDKENKVKATATLLDESGVIGKAYEAKTTPHMFVINSEGTLVYMGAIDSIKSTNPSDIIKAERYVANALDATLAGTDVQVASTQPYGCGIKYE
jgi:peroxiredoxin